jgi:hypothetical protein
MTHDAILAQKLELEFGYKPTESPWHPPTLYAMDDGTQKLQADLKPGDIFVADGRRWKVKAVYENGEIETDAADKPEPCPMCGHTQWTGDEMPF